MTRLLDTSVVIDYLRQKDKEKTLLYLLSQDTLNISLVTHTELFSGKSVWERKQAREELDDLLDRISILPFTLSISSFAGKLHAYARNIDIVDAIIAATALEYDLELVTLNRKDFEPIERLRLYVE